jgi:hypothetical protein
MQGWRFLGRVLPWLLAPAWLVAACGGTVERVRDDANATGGAAGTSKGGSRSDNDPVGGTTLLPTPVAGRGGTSVMIEGGSGGTLTMLPPGISDMPKSVSCSPIAQCSSSTIGPVFIDPCCTEDEACGLDTAALALLGVKFTDECQAKDQPGVRETACPSSAPTAVPFQGIMVPVNGFAGCCRDDGKCGVIADAITSPGLGQLAQLGLGCVDSAPFFGGVPAKACGGGEGGYGGVGGVGASDFGGEASVLGGYGGVF